jgi:hypothetical protein
MLVDRDFHRDAEGLLCLMLKDTIGYGGVPSLKLHVLAHRKEMVDPSGVKPASSASCKVAGQTRDSVRAAYRPLSGDSDG